MIQDMISGVFLNWYYSVWFWVWAIGGVVLLIVLVLVVANLFGRNAARHTAFAGLAALAAFLTINRSQRQGWEAREQKIDIEERRAQRRLDKIRKTVGKRTPDENRQRLKRWRPK